MSMENISTAVMYLVAFAYLYWLWKWMRRKVAPKATPVSVHQEVRNEGTNEAVEPTNEVTAVSEPGTGPAMETSELGANLSLKTREDVIRLLVQHGWGTTKIRETVKGTSSEIGRLVEHYRKAGG